MIDIKEGYCFSKKTSELYKFKYGYDEFPDSLYADNHVGTTYSFTREFSADEIVRDSCRDFIIDDVSNSYERDIEDLEDVDIHTLISMFESKHYVVVPCIFSYYGSQGCSLSINDWGYYSDCNDIKCNYFVIVDKGTNNEDDDEIKIHSKEELRKIIINELELLNDFFNGEVYEIEYKEYDFKTHLWSDADIISNIYCKNQDDVVRDMLGDDVSIIDESEAYKIMNSKMPETIEAVVTDFKHKVLEVSPLFDGNLKHAIQHVSMILEEWKLDILKLVYGTSSYNEEYIDVNVAEEMFNYKE